jgi:predicted Zn-dependent protease with MMP-like domain
MPSHHADDRSGAQPDRFESLVERAIDSLPERFARLLADVAIVIEDEPGPGEYLYGLYEGVPGIEWGADMAPFPNKITLFQVPLESDFPDPDELAEQVRRTLIHELAHHAGISDQRLHELDYD